MVLPLIAAAAAEGAAAGGATAAGAGAGATGAAVGTGSIGGTAAGGLSRVGSTLSQGRLLSRAKQANRFNKSQILPTNSTTASNIEAGESENLAENESPASQSSSNIGSILKRLQNLATRAGKKNNTGIDSQSIAENLNPEAIANKAAYEGSRKILGQLWELTIASIETVIGPFICLFGLNIYMVFTWFIREESFAPLGSDDVYGILFGGGSIAENVKKVNPELGKSAGSLAKFMEIITIVVLDVLILAILILVMYIVYKLFSLTLWDKATGVWYIITGSTNNLIDLLMP